jgi:hypothetical protein
MLILSIKVRDIMINFCVNVRDVATDHNQSAGCTLVRGNIIKGSFYDGDWVINNWSNSSCLFR